MRKSTPEARKVGTDRVKKFSMNCLVKILPTFAITETAAIMSVMTAAMESPFETPEMFFELFFLSSFFAFPESDISELVNCHVFVCSERVF